MSRQVMIDVIKDIKESSEKENGMVGAGRSKRRLIYDDYHILPHPYKFGNGRYKSGGSIANKRAASNNPWLHFLREWRASTGSNDLRLAAEEYRRLGY